jgi:hypothetical protein
MDLPKMRSGKIMRRLLCATSLMGVFLVTRAPLLTLPS